MTKEQSPYTTTNLWEDRWVQPSLEDLLGQLEGSRADVFKSFVGAMQAAPGVSGRVSWGGDGWAWTYEFNSSNLERDPNDDQVHDNALAYVVCDPRPEPIRPYIVITLSNEFIETLPFRRLNRYIREGIKSSKTAVDITWATWVPGTPSDVEHLLDLLRRKIAFLNQIN